jgi:hypothetical protein
VILLLVATYTFAVIVLTSTITFPSTLDAFFFGTFFESLQTWEIDHFMPI